MLSHQGFLPADAERLARTVFHDQGLFSEMDFVAMKEGKPDELFAAWLALPDKQSNAMDAELLEGNWIGVGEGFKGKISWFRGLIKSS